MKTIRFIATAMIAVTTSAFIFAGVSEQSTMATVKTETIKVSGKCEMCKSTIEKAAKINGVSKAEWNKETMALTLVYDPAVVSSDAVQKSIAAVGYDTEKFKATEAAYKALPSCCQYDKKGCASKGTSESCK